MNIRLSRGIAAVMAVGALMLSGCVSRQEVKSFPTVDQMAAQSGNGSTDQNIRLRAGDSLMIRLGGVPIDEINQVTGEYTVDTQGYVNMPAIGRVRAEGLTQSEFQTAVEKRYRDTSVYSNPTVTVSVPLTARFVNVGGEVRLPQRVPYTPDLTVLSAITAAGGFTEYAAQTRVRLYRGGEFDVLNMKTIRRYPNRDIPLQPGDSIEVMRSFF